MRALVVIASLAVLSTGTSADARPAAVKPQPPAPVQQLVPLEQVAEFEHQATGVTLSRDGRVFLNFPRWTEDTAVSVAELSKDGSLKPYPDAEWNTWRNSKHEVTAKNHWVCVQSVVADGAGNLWVLDPAAPAFDKVVAEGAKLVRIDLANNRVAQTISFNPTIAPQGSYLNDVRITNDGKTAFITDSGARGAIVVVDLQSGSSRRVLDGDISTQPEKDVVVQTDGKPLRRADGRGQVTAADGISLSPDGNYLYWQPMTGKTIHRIQVSALIDPNFSPSALASKVDKVAEGEPSDGYWMDSQGRLYISAIGDNAVKVWDGKRFVTVVQDARLRWPDTFSQGPDGMIYVTASHIMDNAWFNPSAGPAIHTQLFRFQPPQPTAQK